MLEPGQHCTHEGQHDTQEGQHGAHEWQHVAHKRQHGRLAAIIDFSMPDIWKNVPDIYNITIPLPKCAVSGRDMPLKISWPTLICVISGKLPDSWTISIKPNVQDMP